MVAPLKFYRQDPNGKGRGRGAYYHRGNGVYSKYSQARDLKKKSKGWRKDKIGLPVDRRTSIPHTGDGTLMNWKTKKRPKPKKK